MMFYELAKKLCWKEKTHTFYFKCGFVTWSIVHFKVESNISVLHWRKHFRSLKACVFYPGPWATGDPWQLEMRPHRSLHSQCYVFSWIFFMTQFHEHRDEDDIETAMSPVPPAGHTVWLKPMHIQPSHTLVHTVITTAVFASHTGHRCVCLWADVIVFCLIVEFRFLLFCKWVYLRKEILLLIYIYCVEYVLCRPRQFLLTYCAQASKVWTPRT